MSLRLLFCCALLLVVPIPSIAQPLEEEAVPVEELIERAIQNSPALVAAQETESAAQQRGQGVGAFPNPTLSATAGFTGSDEARDEELLISQPLDVFNTRHARRRVADAELGRARAEGAGARLNLILEVKRAAAALYAAQEEERLAGVALEHATQFRDAAKRRVELGDAAPVQAERAGIELLRVHNELEGAQSARRTLRAALNALIGEAPDKSLSVAWPFPGATANPTPEQRNALLEAALQHPELIAGAAQQTGRRARIEVLRRERLPKVELQVRRDGVWNGGSSTAIRAAVTMPLFDFGSLKKEQRALQAEARAGDAQLALERARARAGVEQALSQLAGKLEVAQRYREGIVPQTAELLRKMQVGYAQGASSYLEVLEAQRTMRQVQAEYLAALQEARLSALDLESITGQPVALAGGGD